MARISTTAFVRVNTKELREKLEALGFRNNESLNSSSTRSYGLLARLIESKNKYIISLPEESQETTGLFKAEEYIKKSTADEFRQRLIISHYLICLIKRADAFLETNY